MDHEMEFDSKSYSEPHQELTGVLNDDFSWRSVRVQEDPDLSAPQKIANYPKISADAFGPVKYTPMNADFENCVLGSELGSSSHSQFEADQNQGLNAAWASGINQRPAYEERTMHAAPADAELHTAQAPHVHSSRDHKFWEYGGNYDMAELGAMSTGPYQPSAPLMDEVLPTSGSYTPHDQYAGGERWSQNESYGSFPPSNLFATSLEPGRDPAAYQSSHTASSVLGLPTSGGGDLDLNSGNPESGQTELRSNTSAGFGKGNGGIGDEKENLRWNPVGSVGSTSYESEQQASANLRDQTSFSSDQLRTTSSPSDPDETQGMIMNHEQKLEHLDQSAVAQSPYYRPPRSSGDGEFLTSSSGAKLFQLMDIREDMQDLSFVEKIILPRGQIVSFCRVLDAESAKESRGGELSLSFERLNRCSLNVVGFYGSKDLLVECLRSYNTITTDDPVYAKMHDDSLFPGLYALLAMPERTLYVFYWHQGQNLQSASRKDISCNFVRYLVDLCDSVFILVDGSQQTLRESLEKGKSSQTVRLIRKIEMRVEKKQATKDAVEFIPGFSLQLNAIRATTGHAKQFGMCEGSRCGILSHMIVPPKRFWQRKQIVKSLQEISTGGQLFSGTLVSFKGLQVEDLGLFLQCSGCSVGKEYVRFLESLEQRRDEFSRSRGRDREQRLTKYDEEVQKAITDFISEYLTAAQEFSWEEALLKDTSVEVLQGMLCTAQDELRSGASQKNDWRRKLIDQFQFWGNTTDSHDSQLGTRARLASLDMLEARIFTGFGKFNRAPHRFIFRNNRVVVQPRNYRDPNPQVYTVEYAPHEYGSKGGRRNRSGPLCFHDILVLRPLRPRAHQQMKQVAFLQKDKSYDGPLVTNMRVLDGSSRAMGAQYELKVVEDEFAAGGLRGWVASEAAQILPQLGRKASLLSYRRSAYGQSQDAFVQRVLMQSDTKFLEDLVRNQSPEIAGEIMARWREICTTGGATEILLEDILRQCKAVYTTARKELFSLFQVWFKRHMRPILEKWIGYEDEEDKKVFEEGLEKERITYLQNLRQSQTPGGQSGLKLSSCYIDTRAGHSMQSGSNLIISKLIADPVFRQSVLVVGYEQEASEFETEKWLVQEISPSKHDLDAVEKDPNHSFCPRLQGPQEILSLDPSSQTLLMLAFLKTGQYLAFVLTAKADVPQNCEIFLISTSGRKVPVHRCKKGYDLIAFDDQTRFLALYDQDRELIKLFRFEEAYKQLDYCGVEVDLREVGVSNLTWMKYIPGRAELVFIDFMHKVRVFDMAVRQVRPSDIQLPGSFLKAEVTSRGPCLLVFSEPVSRSERDDGRGSATATPVKEVEVYRIDHTMAHVNTVVMPNTSQWGTLLNTHSETAVRSFGSQEHILCLVGSEHQKIVSHCLKITVASEVYQLSSDRASTINGPQQLGTGLPLDYLYHVYEKFSTNPPVIKQPRALSFFVVLRSGDQHLKNECLNSLKSTFYKLDSERGKNFHRLQTRFQTRELREVPQVLADIAHTTTSEKQTIWMSVRSMGGWIRQLLCLVPLQIARAENNCLRPLADGLELSADVDYDNTISLANLLRFGFYDAVFASWRNKPVKIISSMGKQSTGKSYLLNHLSGSLLDVSGGRCTNGVWMTVRFDEGSEENACMYVLLDFEGLGTFERSEQEDMLLSVLNAAISNMTIYNTKEFNLDRETETVFSRFQSGVSLVKADDKLFKGVFHFAFKDVGAEALDALYNELNKKISQRLANSRENFLTTMYGGRVILSLMAPFSTANFYQDIDQMYKDIASPELEASYMDGRSFSTDLKLLIAQISAQEWTPIDSKRIELRVHLLRAHLNSAVSMGHLDTKSHEGTLVNFDSHEEITDNVLQLDGKVFRENDTGLKLKPSEGDSVGSVLSNLKEMFQEMMPRDGQNDETWHTAFVGFVEGVVNRRKQRVLEWIASNVRNFQQQDDIERLTLEAVTMCSELMQLLSVCSCTCKECFLRCIREKGHADGHSCLGDHLCTQSCSFCLSEKDAATADVDVNKCEDVAGHQGSHDCRTKSHTCSKACEYDGLAANCNKICVGTVGHEGGHRCNSREHKCAQKCSLRSCNNLCITPFEITDHSRHICHEKFCPLPCSMQGCNRRCESKDHFHDETRDVIHSCGLSHPCLEQCEARGNCAVQQDLIKTIKTYSNKFGSFEYEHVAEQTGIRKSCCIEIPPFQTKHEGPHLHSMKENIVHFCDVKCPACGYFCSQPIGHPGLHNTVHGNMRGTTFSAESEEIKLDDRKYEWGDSGAAEMCNMHCKKQGRGHIHLVLCPRDLKGGVCYSRLHADGVRHETIKYGPDFDVPKDEMTHAAYWRHTQFVDPCSHEDQKLFNSCPHRCPSEEHKGNSLTSAADEIGKSPESFCTLSLWHAPVSADENNLNRGNITIDGHHMQCTHVLPSNVVFVIDRSYSMSSKDVTPQFVQFQVTHNNRLGCVSEAILRFIRTRHTMSETGGIDLASVVLFNNTDPAITVVEMEPMDEIIVDKLLDYEADGNTNFSTGLKEAERILLKAKRDQDERDPVVIFLSDGENWGSDEAAMDIIRSMRSEHGDRLKIFTVKFGHEKETILERMADLGQSYVSGDLQKLTETFITVARSLKPPISSLMTNGGNERRRSNKISFSTFFRRGSG